MDLEGLHVQVSEETPLRGQDFGLLKEYEMVCFVKRKMCIRDSNYSAQQIVTPDKISDLNIRAGTTVFIGCPNVGILITTVHNRL